MEMYSLTTETGALLVAGGLNPLYIEDVIENTILEDLDGGIDVTSVATVPFEQRSIATFGTRADGCVSGLVIAAAVIEMVCGPHASSIDYFHNDGERVHVGDVLMKIEARGVCCTHPLAVAAGLAPVGSGSDTALPACASFADYLQVLPERRVRIISQKDFIKAISRPLPGFLGGEPIALLRLPLAGEGGFEGRAKAVIAARRSAISKTSSSCASPMPSPMPCRR